MIAASAGLAGVVNALFIGSLYNVEHFMIWTLVLGPFFSPIKSGMSFLMTLMEIYMAMIHFPAKEKDLGSTLFLAWICFMNLLVGLVYMAIMFVFSLAYKGTGNELAYLSQSIHGFWPMLMLCITTSSMSNPSGTTSLWGLVMIPNKYYPIALAAFFFLFNGMRIMWDFVAALIIGYSYGLLKVDRIMPSRVRMGQFEQQWCRGGRCGFLGASWVAAAGTVGYDVDSGDHRYDSLSDFGRNSGGQQMATQGRPAEASTASGGFQVFAGSGNRLGDGGDSSNLIAAVRPPPPLAAVPQAQHLNDLEMQQPTVSSAAVSS